MGAQSGRSGPGCLVQFAGLLLFGAALVLIVAGITSPFAFYLGGHFHIIPYWQGWGRIHSPNGDYLVRVELWPSSHQKYTSHLQGYGELCTPRGERFRLTGGADMQKHVGSQLDGEKIHIYAHNRPWNYQFTTDRRPRFEIYGRWQNPNIVGDDHATLMTEFQPDATLYPPGKQPARGTPLPLTLYEASRDAYNEACKAQQR